MNLIPVSIDSFVVGFVAAPVAYYVLSRFYPAIVADVKAVWNKFFPAKTA